MLTTGAMVRIGKTYGNLMVDVQTGSEKLKDRARRIVNIVTGLEYDDADRLLKRAQWNVKAAIVMQKTGLTYLKALAAAAQGARFDARGARRRHRAAPARDAAGPCRGLAERQRSSQDDGAERGAAAAGPDASTPGRSPTDHRAGSASRPSNRDAAARSRYTSTSRCVCRNDAGRCVVSGSRHRARDHLRLRLPRCDQQRSRPL